MKKLLYLPLKVAGGASEQKYLERSFRKVFEVEIFDFHNFEGNKTEEFLRIVQIFKPDIIHAQFQGTCEILPKSLHQIKTIYPEIIITQWTGDVRSEPIKQYVDYGQYCDFNLVCGTGLIPFYEKVGLKNVIYWQNAIAIPEQIGQPSDYPKKQIVFMGTGSSQLPKSDQRRELIKIFQQTFGEQFKLYGQGWDDNVSMIPWERQTEIYERSYASLGHNHLDDIRWWFSDRLLIAMASGRPHLAHYSPGLENLFVDLKECLFWRDIPEAVEKTKWLFEDSDRAYLMGKRGQQKVAALYNWDIRVKEYIKILNL